tara:strand:+ start:606 stop:752 length:147 start_codon:yes stop_codon:yes gene_type:complete
MSGEMMMKENEMMMKQKRWSQACGRDLVECVTTKMMCAARSFVGALFA